MKHIPITAEHAIGCACKQYKASLPIGTGSDTTSSHSIRPCGFPDKGWLKSDIADAICTTIVLGYAEQLASMELTAEFGYENDSDEAIHSEIVSLFAHLGVTIKCSKLVAKTTNPLIVAKDSYVSSGAPSSVLGQLDAVVSAANLSNLRLDQPPYSAIKYYGAYIGGTYDGTTTNLIGVSKLDQYNSQYRDLSVSEKTGISKKFNDANDVSVAVDKFLSEISPIVLRNKSIKLSNESGGTFVPMKKQAYNSTKGLFKSYHGMIRALKLIPNPSASDTTYFEISAGKDTSKIASCFPCGTYMLAADRPATAVHLGRGDNWNIPDYRVNVAVNNHDSTTLKTLTTSDNDTCWAFDISLYYLLGLGKLKEHPLFNQLPYSDKADSVSTKLSKTKPSRNFVRKLSEDSVGMLHEIPEMFLEALTFEKSFSNRIAETLKF